jgi:hypothetical protein
LRLGKRGVAGAFASPWVGLTIVGLIAFIVVAIFFTALLFALLFFIAAIFVLVYAPKSPYAIFIFVALIILAAVFGFLQVGQQASLSLGQAIHA